MALQGTLDTFALPDVLRLLASTKKVGRMRVTGDGGSGSLWVDGGTVVGSELLVRGAQADSLTEVLFNLLRFANGSFTFEAGAMPPANGVARDAESIIVEAELMLGEWRALELVVPSLDSWLTLTHELKGRDVVVDSARWRIIVTVGSGATVGEVGRRVGLGDLAVMRAVKEVIELGLVEVTAPALPESVTTEAVKPEAVAHDVVVASTEVVTELGPVTGFDAGAGFEHEVDEITERFIGGSASMGDPREGSSFVIEPFLGELDDTADIATYAAADDPVTDLAVDVPMFSNDTPIVPQSITEIRSGLGAMHLSHEPARDTGRDTGRDMGRDTARRSVAYDAPLEDPSEIARQLASLSPRAAKAVAAAAKATTEEERDAALATIEAEDDTINRGLLLKFLGAVDR